MTTDAVETPVEITAEQIEALKNKNVAVLTIMMPPGMRDAINEAAEAASTSAATFARQALAEKIGYALPAQGATRVKKYATEEERAAANKAAAKSRRDQVNALLDALKRGEIQL